MAEYLAPGVFIEEIEIGAKSIEGVSTSTTAFIGETERGPVEPRLITGIEEYRRLYGSHSWVQGGQESNSYMRHAVDGFFRNGGKRAFIARVVGAGATIAELKIQAKEAATVQHQAEIGRTGQTNSEENPEEKDSDWQDTQEDGGDNQANLQEVETKPVDALTVIATGPGSWGNNVFIVISDATMTKMRGDLFRLEAYYQPIGAKERYLVEHYDNLSPDRQDSQFCEKRVNGLSSIITVTSRTGRPPKNTTEDVKDDKGNPVTKSVACALSGGRDYTEANEKKTGSKDEGEPLKKISLADYQGEDVPGKRRGLAALAEIDEISIVCAPNEPEITGLTDAIVDHCENLKNRFAVLQAPLSAGQVGDLRPARDSKYAAFYYPWVKTLENGLVKDVPPCGHLAGVYARTDVERGVFKAPANEVVRGIIGLQFTVTTGEQETLNPRGVNCIRSFEGRGIRIWGARTTSSDPSWKYVNVRRLFIFLEESIRRSTQWVVFEPNNEQLWDRVVQTVSDFLIGVWRTGALMGRTASEAFFVKCDRTTMTNNDIDNGRLIVVIGVAPTKPAEFVIFRIAQWRSGSATEE
jgi:phage tail sheath protein FI